MTAVADAPVVDLTAATPALQLIPLDLLFDCPDNPRNGIGDVAELAKSIKAVGILEPLIVTTAEAYAAADGFAGDAPGGTYVVIAGHRRKKAAREAKLDAAPCIVRTDLVGNAAREAMLVENLQRVDLTPVEEAQAFDALVTLGNSQRDIATRVGVTQPHISKRLSLLKLPPAVQKDIAGGTLTVGDALDLIPLAGNEDAIRRARHTDAWDRRPMAERVESVKRELERERKVEETIAKLKDSGVARVLKGSTYDPWNGKKRPLDELRREGNKLPGHDKEPCHAVMVNSDANTKAFCTDITKHGIEVHDASMGRISTSKKPAAEQKHLQQERERRGRQYRARQAFLDELFTRKLAAGTLTTFALRGATILLADGEQDWGNTDARVGRWLGIDPGEWRTPKDLAALVITHADHSGPAAARVLFALVLDAMDYNIGDDEGGYTATWDDANGTHLLKFLTDHGYDPAAEIQAPAEDKS